MLSICNVLITRAVIKPFYRNYHLAHTAIILTMQVCFGCLKILKFKDYFWKYQTEEFV